jgi:hypothetical protein
MGNAPGPVFHNFADGVFKLNIAGGLNKNALYRHSMCISNGLFVSAGSKKR